MLTLNEGRGSWKLLFLQGYDWKKQDQQVFILFTHALPGWLGLI
jgi:hypothetical protein